MAKIFYPDLDLGLACEAWLKNGPSLDSKSYMIPHPGLVRTKSIPLPALLSLSKSVLAVGTREGNFEFVPRLINRKGVLELYIMGRINFMDKWWNGWWGYLSSAWFSILYPYQQNSDFYFPKNSKEITKLDKILFPFSFACILKKYCMECQGRSKACKWL